MTNTNDGLRKISARSLRTLEELWLTDFHKRSAADYEHGNAERWWNVFLDFLNQRGDEVLPAVVREREEQLLALGKSQEYLAALLEEIQVNNQERNEYELAMLVLTASVDERVSAIKRVLP